MWVSIHGQGLAVGAAEREAVRRRLGFALGRFGDQVGRVTVLLVDLNGPRGGVDKRCRVVAGVLGRGQVVAEDTGADVWEAVDRAAHRTEQAVRRRLDRGRLFVSPAPGRALETR